MKKTSWRSTGVDLFLPLLSASIEKILFVEADADGSLCFCNMSRSDIATGPSQESLQAIKWTTVHQKVGVDNVTRFARCSDAKSALVLMSGPSSASANAIVQILRSSQFDEKNTTQLIVSGVSGLLPVHYYRIGFRMRQWSGRIRCYVCLGREHNKTTKFVSSDMRLSRFFILSERHKMSRIDSVCYFFIAMLGLYSLFEREHVWVRHD